MDTTSTPQPQDSSSKRHFHWTNNAGNKDIQVPSSETMSKIIKEDANTKGKDEQEQDDKGLPLPGPVTTSQRRKLQAVAISRLRSVLTVFGKNRSSLPFGLGSRVVGTLFGYHRDHVHFAFQKDPSSQPAFLNELATPITGLVREMAFWASPNRAGMRQGQRVREEEFEVASGVRVEDLLQRQKVWLCHPEENVERKTRKS
ncbi:hypothetical protein LR48_Vigan11g100400 [Vigna angularis]|uniref:Uncharacterized protein n=1 Tax=Phaseolus angularis TaxID=3914 RepID=A0A0L9VSD6_PHAAN|nr:hypothetical protein LR48_Vigan11g100400 [Vigna angularis]